MTLAVQLLGIQECPPYPPATAANLRLWTMVQSNPSGLMKSFPQTTITRMTDKQLVKLIQHPEPSSSIHHLDAQAGDLEFSMLMLSYHVHGDAHTKEAR